MKFYFFITDKGFRFASAKRYNCFSKRETNNSSELKFIENIEIDSVKLKNK